MKLATAYGVKADGSVANIKTGDIATVEKIWQERNPEQFVRIGYFAEGRKKRERVVNANSK